MIVFHNFKELTSFGNFVLCLATFYESKLFQNEKLKNFKNERLQYCGFLLFHIS